MTEGIDDPLLTFHFSLDIAGALTGIFTHVGGLGSESEVVELKSVKDGKEFVKQQPGRTKWTPITLKRGITKNLEIWKWRQDVIDGKVKDFRKACSIIAYSDDGAAVAQWDLVDAWPSKVTGPEFDGTTGTIMFEEVTLVFDGFKRVK
jgi:phage tail-like protein